MNNPFSILIRSIKYFLVTLLICTVFAGFYAALADGPFDGRWSGALNATDSLMGCTGSTFPLELRVRDGAVTGSLRLPVGGPQKLRGTVTPDGVITVTATGDRAHARSASHGMTALRLDLSGTLAGGRGEGAWSSNILGDCNGEFVLRRR